MAALGAHGVDAECQEEICVSITESSSLGGPQTFCAAITGTSGDTTLFDSHLWLRHDKSNAHRLVYVNDDVPGPACYWSLQKQVPCSSEDYDAILPWFSFTKDESNNPHQCWEQIAARRPRTLGFYGEVTVDGGGASYGCASVGSAQAVKEDFDTIAGGIWNTGTWNHPQTLVDELPADSGEHVTLSSTCSSKIRISKISNKYCSIHCRFIILNLNSICMFQVHLPTRTKPSPAGSARIPTLARLKLTLP